MSKKTNGQSTSKRNPSSWIIRMLRRKASVRYVNHYPYTVKESWDDNKPNWRRYQNNHDFNSYDTIYIIQENKTKRIFYLYAMNSLDEGIPCKRMYKHYENVLLPKMKENEKLTDAYKVIGMDYDVARDKFMCLGDQFTVHFEMPGIEYHHPHDIYPYSMSIKEINKKECERVQGSDEYWTAHNINAENLGDYPPIE